MDNVTFSQVQFLRLCRKSAIYLKLKMIFETENHLLEFYLTRYNTTMGYKLGRRLMISGPAVFADILQHSHSTGFCSEGSMILFSIYIVLRCTHYSCFKIIKNCITDSFLLFFICDYRRGKLEFRPQI